MRENGIRARHKRRYKATTDSKHTLPVAQNLLDRELRPGRRPIRRGRADITYIWTDEGWLYLAVVHRSVQPRGRGLVDQAAA